MSLLKNVSHIGRIFILAITLFIVAAAIILLERYAKSWGMPNDFLFGMHTIGVALFITDAILVIGSSVIFTIKALIRQWREE